MKLALNHKLREEATAVSSTKQFSTFYVEDRLYGIDVMQVQEVTKPLPMTLIRCAPPYVKGLINLRGQISTAIGLKELFELKSKEGSEDKIEDKMTVVCRVDGILLSFLVDRIGDVMELPDDAFENTPQTIEQNIKEFMVGVYKTSGPTLSVIGIEQICNRLNQKEKV